MIICLKSILNEGFSFIDNVKIINANLNFFLKVPTQKAKSGLYKHQIDTANLKSFSNQHSDYALKSSPFKSSLQFLSFLI